MRINYFNTIVLVLFLKNETFFLIKKNQITIIFTTKSDIITLHSTACILKINYKTL